MVLYTCIKCKKEFKKKSDYVYHTENKKRPCIQIDSVKNAENSPILIKIDKNSPILTKINQNKINNVLDVLNVLNIRDEVDETNKPDITIQHDHVKNTFESNNLTCTYCCKTFVNIYTLKRHLDGRCKVKKLDNEKKDVIFNKLLENENKMEKVLNSFEDIKKDNQILQKNYNNVQKNYDSIYKENEKLKKQIKDLEKQLDTKSDVVEIIDKLTKLEKVIPDNESKIVNDKLINIIIDKDKKINDLKNNIETNHDNKLIIKNDETNNNSKHLILNNQVIMFRENDKYINATQMCKSKGKKFSDWFRLDSTKELIKELAKNIGAHNNPEFDKSNTESDAGIPASQLIDIKKGNSEKFDQGTWIHPDLAIQLAQWISPNFALKVSFWIRSLFVNGKIDLSAKLEEKEKKIKILQDLVIKKQKRVEYQESNVVYLITTEDNKKKSIYIVGKAIDFKKRLSTYNKTSEHEVMYYKGFQNKEQMELCEKLILNKLDKYREKANRDRFILPVGEDIKLFTNIFDKCVDVL